MSDRWKIFTALLFLVAAFLLPLIAFLLGWNYRDITSGIAAAVVLFVVLVGGAFIFLLRVNNLNVFSASLPYLFGTLYAIVPDAIIGPFDDASMLSVGMVLSYILEIRRNAQAPKWIIIFPVIALIYIFIGGLFPGPIDELFVGSLLYAAYLGVNAAKERQNQDKPGPDLQ